PPTEIHTPSLHDALPIWPEQPSRSTLDPEGKEPLAGPDPPCPSLGHRMRRASGEWRPDLGGRTVPAEVHRRTLPPGATSPRGIRDRKSTRLNSSHVEISY